MFGTTLTYRSQIPDCCSKNHCHIADMSSDSHPRVPRSVRYQAVDLSEISSGKEWKQREGHNFLRLSQGGVMKNGPLKGGVMQIYARDNVEVHPQKKKEVLYLVKKKKKKRTTEHCGYKL